MTLTEGWRNAGGESRTEFYRTWRTLAKIPSVSDIDQVEYTIRRGNSVANAVVELSVADYGPMSSRFLDAVLKKVASNRGQGKILRTVASALDVDFYVVSLLKNNLKDFWLYNITEDSGWSHLDAFGYRNWLKSIRGIEI